MRKSWCTIMNFSWYSFHSCYQFLAFWWLSLIGICLVISKEAIEIRIMPWIALKSGFQIWVFWQFFQVCEWLLGAAQCVSSLGFPLGLCSESIRSRKVEQIQCNDGFWKFDFLRFSQSFSMCFLIQISSNCSNSFHIDLCTKSWE